jgi:hypothetical protein
MFVMVTSPLTGASPVVLRESVFGDTLILPPPGVGVDVGVAVLVGVAVAVAVRVAVGVAVAVDVAVLVGVEVAVALPDAVAVGVAVRVAVAVAVAVGVVVAVTVPVAVAVAVGVVVEVAVGVAVAVALGLHLPAGPASTMDWISVALKARSNNSISSMSPFMSAVPEDVAVLPANRLVLFVSVKVPNGAEVASSWPLTYIEIAFDVLTPVTW